MYSTNTECHIVFLEVRLGWNKDNGLYHPLDGITNLKYKLLYFLSRNKKKFKEKDTSF